MAASKKKLWAGRIMSGLVIAFMLFDCAIKLLQLEIVRTSMAQLGYPQSSGLLIGIIEAGCLALYILPRTAVLGAILLTGIYGGAIASHVRLNDPLFSHVLFGVYLGLLTWGGLYLRDEKLRALIPFRR
jgi:DoxX-like family